MDKHIYNNMVKDIGSSVENIIVIKNFVSKENCKLIVNGLNHDTALTFPGFWEDKIFAEFSFNTDIRKVLKKHRLKAHSIVKDLYGKTLLPNSMNQHIIKWSCGSSMKKHIDDESKERSSYHIASLFYLNDNYSGGEIYFPKQDFLIKPESGDLIVFPGNYNYPHEVKEITLGERYTAPNWYRFP